MRHMYSIECPICELESSIETIGEATRVVYRVVDCSDCLRRALAEADERVLVLRELLAQLEVVS